MSGFLKTECHEDIEIEVILLLWFIVPNASSKLYFFTYFL